MPPHSCCQEHGTPSPEVTESFCRVPSTQFSQRLSILYLSTCVGLRYDLCLGYFLEISSSCTNPLTHNTPSTPSLPNWCRNINLLPIDYGSRPRLRGRLTLRGLPVRRKPWTFGRRVSHTPFRYSCQHSHFCYLQHTSRYTFFNLQNAPLPHHFKAVSVSSVIRLSPGTFSTHDNLIYRLVSYYAFFKGWLLLSQPPSCIGYHTFFHT